MSGRKNISIADKLKIVDKFNKGARVSELCKLFNLKASTVSTILKKKENLWKNAENINSKKKNENSEWRVSKNGTKTLLLVLGTEKKSHSHTPPYLGGCKWDSAPSKNLIAPSKNFIAPSKIIINKINMV